MSVHEVDERYFDHRVVEHHIAQGVVTRQQYDDYLASLEDSSDLSTETTTRMERSEPPDGEEQ